jgi:MFS family permease
VVVALLMVAYTFSFLDRQILALLVVDIQEHLGVSDTQIGLLQGLAFTIFYTTLGIPIARLADRKNRRNLIAAGVFLWSVMTVACGFAKNFATLFMTRMGVGVGEAALSPAAYSIITDYFPRHHLSKALAVYAMGVYIGGGVAFTLGGYLVQYLSVSDFSAYPLISELQGWQLAFIAAGLPGILVALVIYLFVREPQRKKTASAARWKENMSLSDAVGYLRNHRRAYFPIYLGFSLQAISIFALFSWLPTQYIREFGWEVSRAGQSVGLAILVLGCLGVIVGGVVTDRLLKARRFDAPLLLGLFSSVGIALPIVLANLIQMPPETKAMVFSASFFFMGLVAGPAPASIALIAPQQLRAQLSAVFIFSINFIGMTLGPLLPALISDSFPAHVTSIGIAIAIVVAASCGVSILIFGLCRAEYRHTCSAEEDSCKATT